MSASDVETFRRVTRASKTKDGLRAPGLRFGDRRVLAVPEGMLKFSHVVDGFVKWLNILRDYRMRVHKPPSDVRF